MPIKPIKEVYTDIGGNVTVEYSDDSTMKFNQADTVTAVSNPVTGVLEIPTNIPTSFRRTPMLTVVCGNSIAAANKYDGSAVSVGGELHNANVLGGSVMRFGRTVATTRSDILGVYGYSGATLDTINGDIEAQWFAPMHTAGVIPDLVIGLALVENDIIQGATLAQITARLTRWIANVRRFPGVMILLCTPRPATSYNTPSLVAMWQAVTTHMLTLDDGHSIFVTHLNGYEDPVNPSIALAGYTADGLHPNTKGAFKNARSIVATLKRITKSVAYNYRVLSANFGLIGSGAASGTNVSGTMPTGGGFSGTGNQAYISTALNPAWEISASVVAGQTLDVPQIGTGSVAVSGGVNTQVSTYARVEIVSGAECIGFIQLDPRITDGSGNLFQYFQKKNSNDADAEYLNGDMLTIRIPPQIAASTVITAVQAYIGLKYKNGGSGSLATVTGTVVLRIHEAGVGLVVV